MGRMDGKSREGPLQFLKLSKKVSGSHWCRQRAREMVALEINFRVTINGK